MTMMNDIPPCPTCGTYFENIFEATDHLLEDDEDEFDPQLHLQNGYSLGVGSLLRSLYLNAYDPQRIEAITQHTYATLYASQVNPEEMNSHIENIIVEAAMFDIDDELEELLDDNRDGEE